MVVGFDISTTRLDWAWIMPALGPTTAAYPMHRFHLLGPASSDIVARVQNVVNLGLPYEMTEAVIEYPYSVNRQTNASLMAVLGALTTRVDRAARTAWVSSNDLRAAIGAANSKASAHARILELYPGVSQWNEHALDALVACHGWTTILGLQEYL